MPYEPEFLDRLVSTMEARSVSVTYSCKVSVKEDSGLFRGVESGITVSLRSPGMESIPMEAVRLAALKHAPLLAAKVYTDLVVGDVMTPPEASARIAKAREFYDAAYQKVLHEHSGVDRGGVPAVDGSAPGEAPGDDRRS